MKFLLVLFCVFLGNIIWTLGVSYVAQMKALSSANYSALMELMALIAVITIVTEPVYIIPAVIGAWAGTYLTIIWLRREK